jgi:polysaccharide pyruvyl transferase WcaK-like protein
MSFISPRVIRGNRGDIASRYGILQALLAGGTKVSAVFASRPEHLPARLRSRILPYGPLYNLWPALRGLAALRRSKTVIWTGGLDLQDDSSLTKLVHTWLVFLSYRLLGLRILLALQGAGPLGTPGGRFLARRVLSLVDLALVRDKGSERLLRELMPADRLRLAADGIFLDGFPTREAPCPLGSRVAPVAAAGGRPVVGVNVRLWFHFAGSWVPYQFARERYRARAEAPMNALLASIEGVIAHLRARHDARVVLVSMYEPGVEPWEDDLPLLERIKTRFAADDEVVLCTDDLPIEALCGLFSLFDLMIGMRLHSTLIALRAGVPAIHVAYTSKGRDIYGDLGLADWVVAVEDVLRSPRHLIALADRLLADTGRFERVRAAVEPVIAANRQALADAVRHAERP